jgi:cation-transporting P-type ATPase I
MPLRAVTMGLQATSALIGATAQTAATLGTVAASRTKSCAETGLIMATIPVREGVKALSGELSMPTVPVLTRNCWHGVERAWIEVRGLDCPDGAELGRVVVDAVRAHPGVTSASLNRPLSRLVVGFDGDRPSLRDLCRLVDDAEKRWRPVDSAAKHNQAATRPKALPGDGLLMAIRGATAGANAVGLGIALAGRTLRWPGLPISIGAANSLVNYQPALRRLVENRLGQPATNTTLTLVTAAVHTGTLALSSLTVDLMMETLKATESRAQAQAWSRHEPELARHADHADVHPPSRPVPAPAGPAERHTRRSAFVQATSGAAVGAATRSLDKASQAVMVTAPKAMRTTRESFAATLGQGLAKHHAVLPLCPDSLRRLDRIDALLVDPRVLCTDTLRVVRVRRAGDDAKRSFAEERRTTPAGDDELSLAWSRAQELLEQSDLDTGWHPIPGMPARGSDPGVEALVGSAHDQLASAILAEARRSGLTLASVDTDTSDELGELRPAFDELRPLKGPLGHGSVDDALTAALTSLQESGHTVAVMSSAGAQALSSADLGLGIMPISDAEPPPWTADLIFTSLAGVWQVLHALPAARTATQRGIEIATGASSLGALLMLPGVRLRGPAPVAAGAAAGLLSGYLLARRVLRVSAPLPAPIHEWHAMSVEQVRKVLPPPSDVDQVANELTGLAPTGRATLAMRAMETAQRRARLTGRPRKALWQFAKAVGAELSDPLTPVLALGSAASAVLGSPVDAVLVGSVLTGNSVLAASQRLRAESRLNELLAQQIPPARKVTTGPGGVSVYTDVIAAQLRPGDVIEVRTHEVIPADARLIAEDDIEVDESTLTGESLPVEKQIDPTPGADLAERRCMLFAGTTVVAGTAVALVTAVGADTQARRAAELASAELPVVGLQHQLSQLTNRAFPVSMAGGALVAALGLLRRRGLRQAVASGIAVTVAAVPEGMPLVATLAQAASARRLAEYGALVRIPRSVEALGRVDAVCFDKTGTLSENRLRVARVLPADGYSREEVLRYAAHAAPASSGGPHVHATDRAIIEAALSGNPARAATMRPAQRGEEEPRNPAPARSNGSGPGAAPMPDAKAMKGAAHLPFRSGRSFSASVSDDELTVKGAPEVVLAACRSVDSDPRGDDAARAAGGGGAGQSGEASDSDWDPENTVRQLAAEGLRVIAVARRRLTPQQAKLVQDDDDAIADLAGDELSLAGFLGLSDTPRAEAPGLIAALSERELDIRLITGDHPITATAIARELGIPVTAEEVISGAEWDALSRKDQERAVTERVIFARMSPENKVQIVQTLERVGKVCAMVGDGSNDAAAIRAATVGVAVVARDSDPARTAADVVLVDGRIEALLNAIEEGGQLWQRVQAAVSVLLGGNAGEVGFAVIGSAISGSSPLNTRQLLLVNMLTDALPAAALAVSKPGGPVQPAGRGPDQRALWRAVTIRGTTTAAAATAAWTMARFTGRPRRASTVALVALVSAQLGQTLLDSRAPLVVLTTGGSLVAMGTLISIPGISQLLGCTPLGPLGWAQALGSAGAATVALAAAGRAVGGQSPSEQDVLEPNVDGPSDETAQPSQRRNAKAPRTSAAPARSEGERPLRLVGRREHPSSTTYV